MEGMENQPRRFEPFDKSSGVVYGCVGAVLLALAATLLCTVEGAALLGLTWVVAASGGYFTIAGAVARGIQLSRR